MDIIHNQDKNRFEVKTGAYLSVLEYRLRKPNKILYTHTGVPEEVSGQGIGEALVVHGLDYAREQGLSVYPYCPFVRSYIKSNPAYQDLVADDFRVREKAK